MEYLEGGYQDLVFLCTSYDISSFDEAKGRADLEKDMKRRVESMKDEAKTVRGQCSQQHDWWSLAILW